MKISNEDQKLYCLAVGTLLYLLKYSRPCLANPLCELSKVLDGASEGTFKKLKCVIKFVLDTADYGLKIKPIKKPVGEAWTMTVFSDSDYTGDTKTRISITGFCVFFMGVPISWKSCTEKRDPVIKQSRICGSVRGHKRNQVYCSSPAFHWD